MSIENVKEFYEAVSKDEALKQKLVELSQKHQGQQMDEIKVMAEMDREVMSLAAQMGYSFTIDDLKACETEMKQKLGCELGDSDLAAVSGGQFINNHRHGRGILT